MWHNNLSIPTKFRSGECGLAKTNSGQVATKRNAWPELDEVLREYQCRQATSLVSFMRSVMNDKTSTDVTLVAETQSFPAHKNILRGRSAVFAAMFDSGMQESLTGEVKIVDFGANVVKAMLEYIYTGDITTAANDPFEVVKIADRYELLELRDACEKIILSTLSLRNASEALILADQLQLSIKSRVMDYVNSYRRKFVKTESYDKLAKRHPRLVVELYGRLSDSGDLITPTPAELGPGNYSDNFSCLFNQEVSVLVTK